MKGFKSKMIFDMCRLFLVECVHRPSPDTRSKPYDYKEGNKLRREPYNDYIDRRANE